MDHAWLGTVWCYPCSAEDLTDRGRGEADLLGDSADGQRRVEVGSTIRPCTTGGTRFGSAPAGGAGLDVGRRVLLIDATAPWRQRSSGGPSAGGRPRVTGSGWGVGIRVGLGTSMFRAVTVQEGYCTHTARPEMPSTLSRSQACGLVPPAGLETVLARRRAGVEGHDSPATRRERAAAISASRPCAACW